MERIWSLNIWRKEWCSHIVHFVFYTDIWQNTPLAKRNNVQQLLTCSLSLNDWNNKWLAKATKKNWKWLSTNLKKHCQREINLLSIRVQSKDALAGSIIQDIIKFTDTNSMIWPNKHKLGNTFPTPITWWNIHLLFKSLVKS